MIELRGKYNTAKVFTDNVETTAQSQIIELCNQDFTQGGKIRIMPDCLTEDTEILTDNGFKLIKDLNHNDLIANVDTNHNNIVFFNKPKDIIIRQVRADEKVYEYINNNLGISIKSTENHRNAYKYNMGIKTLEMPNEIPIKSLVWNGTGLTIENEYNISDIHLQLLIWIIGDGNIKITDNHTSKNYRIRFGLKKERKINRIVELLNVSNINYYKNSTDKQTEIYLSTCDSKYFIDLIGTEKQLSTHLSTKLSTRQANLFLEEAIQVDGDYNAYINNRGMRFNSNNKQFVDLISAIFSLNFGTSMIKNRGILKSVSGYESNKEMFYVNCIKENSLNFSKSGLHNKKLSKRIINYLGMVVCVTCDTGFFIARQNGRTFVTGNCHAGSGCVIGFTADLGDKVIPNIVGVDIGCGMTTVELGKIDIDLHKLDGVIHQYIPSGKNTHEGRVVRFDKIQELHCYRSLKDTKRMERSIGTLGGGNHFIEVNKDSQDKLYLVIHSGSRNLGKQVADYYQNMAIDLCSGKGDYYLQRDQLIKEYKEQGRRNKIQKVLKNLEKKFNNLHPSYPNDLCFLTGEWREKYLHDMNICQEYASLNRLTMVKIILNNMFGNQLHNIDFNIFHTIHNYINFKDNIIRKGAISAYKDEKVLIPINMRDGSILAIGKGSPDWNYSAPHGAGRLISRRKAKEMVNLEEFEKTMDGIYTTSVGLSTLDEAPMVYKPIQDILDNIGDTVEVIDIIKPIYNFKAGE